MPSSKCFSAFAALLVCGCIFSGGKAGGSGQGAELSGRGFVHYHFYPDTGQCYCGGEFDFTQYHKMVAAASESIHAYFQNDMCRNRKYAYLVSETTGARVRVAIVDKGGQPTSDFNAREQHIMDLSKEAFDSLDIDGEGVKSGRIYVKWAISPE